MPSAAQRRRRVSSGSEGTGARSAKRRNDKGPKQQHPASIQDESDAVEKITVVPTTDSLYQDKFELPKGLSQDEENKMEEDVFRYAPPTNNFKAKTYRHTYFATMRIQRSTPDAILTHQVNMGDMIAFSSSRHGVVEKPLPRTDPWTIGQVLFFVTIQFTPKLKKTFAVVQWLPFYKSQFTKNHSFTKEQKQTLLRSFRPDQALVESQILFMVNVHSILPLQVCLDTWQVFQDRNAKEPELLDWEDDGPVEIYSVFYNCILRHDNTQDVEKSGESCTICLKDVREDWKAYVCNKPQHSPPLVLRRAWKLLMHDRLMAALEKGYEDHLFPIVSNNAANDKRYFRSQWDVKYLRSQSAPEIKPPEVPARKKSAKRKASQPSNLVSSAKKAKQSTAPAKGPRRVSFEGGIQSAQKRRKSLDVAENENNSKSKKAKSTHTLIEWKVQQSPLYTFKPNGKKKPQHKLKVQTQFYASAECEMDPSDIYSAKFTGPKRGQVWKNGPVSWTMHVGDVIAVRLNDASDNRKRTTKSINCYPFLEPWSAGQVLSIYSMVTDTESTSLEMEVRWFCQKHELDEEVQQNMPEHLRKNSCVVEMDEVVSRLRLQQVLAPLRLTSDILNDKQQQKVSVATIHKECVPLWTITCRDLCNTKDDENELYPLDSSDWPSLKGNEKTRLNSNVSHASIRRGLFCERALSYQIAKLTKQYERFLRQRLVDLCGWNSSERLTEWLPNEYQRSSQKQKMYWPETDLKPSLEIVQSQSKDIIHQSGSRDYYNSLSIKVLKQRCDPRALGKKLDEIDLSITVGEVVCLADNDAIMPKTRQANRHYPFAGPWSVYQVLALYKVKRNESNKVEFYAMEGRRLYRPEEMPKAWFEYLPQERTDVPILFESNKIQDNLPASRILGRVDLSLGLSTIRPSSNLTGSDADLSVHCHCSYYYDCAQSRLQPLYVSEACPKMWKRRFVERGLLFSDHVSMNTTAFREILQFILAVDLSSHKNSSKNQRSSISPRRNFRLARLCKDLLLDEETATGAAFTRQPSGEDIQAMDFFHSIKIVPQWSKFQIPDQVCHPKDRKDRLWTVRIGDLVAVPCSAFPSDLFPESTASRPERTTWPPFREPWHVCQVLSLSRQKEPDISNSSIEIRLLQSIESKESVQSPIPSVSEMDIAPYTISEKDLLGPVSVALRNNALFQAAWYKMIKFLPSCPFIFASTSKLDSHGVMMKYLATRAVELSAQYRSDEKEKMMSLMLTSIEEEYEADAASPSRKVPLRRAKSGVSVDSSSASTQSAAACVDGIVPFHSNSTSGNTYFDSFNVKPSYSCFVDRFKSPYENVKWKVSLGDVVTVQYKHTFGPAIYGPETEEKKIRTFPFKESWAIGEIICIFRHQGALKIEVRWFYRFAELQGKVHLGSEARTEQLCEEVFESDHVDLISPDSILGPADVHEKPIDAISSENTFLGMPKLDFVCNRFFSIKRKAPVPCGSLAGRIARGRMHSKIIEKDLLLSQALKNMKEAPAPVVEPEKIQKFTWRDRCTSVINKFSLSDASKEGYEGQFVLVGREKERKHIKAFLEGSVLGSGRDSASSIFIAGPPGTGKTACVFAAVKDMQMTHAKRMPQGFKFVYLNAMEMRHPFEAYVQLWERISGQSQCRPEQAASNLEEYFTESDPDLSSEVIVVLLDEIDYLVTKNQSVLYNFFDWPTRSFKRKLVLLGISNTLNLPEHLHQRVQSRMGNRRCIFTAYSEHQILSIIKSKAELASSDTHIFANDALVFAAKKTSSQSGDLRRAFRFCRMAAEYILNEKYDASKEPPTVRVSDMLKVSRDSFSSAQSKAVAMCTPFEALLLVAVVLLCRSTGREMGGFDVEEIVVKMDSIAQSFGDELYLPAPSLAETLGVLLRLGESHLVSLRSPKTSSVSYRASLNGSGGPWPLVHLLVEDFVIFSALKTSCHRDLAIKHLSHSAGGRRN